MRAAIGEVVAASRPGGTRKGGVVWHTQGSGKSITMTCFAARVMQEPAMQNPTIVVLTDRNDLDGQLFGVFSLALTRHPSTPVIKKGPSPDNTVTGNRYDKRRIIIRIETRKEQTGNRKKTKRKEGTEREKEG